MDTNVQTLDSNAVLPETISHYELDFQCSGNNHYYIWRHRPSGNIPSKNIGMLVDLNDVYVPECEVEKMILSFLAPSNGVVSIAFANCHSHNQQVIKRKLKTGDVKLFSHTAFFGDTDQARQWLESQVRPSC